jgi:vacuolar iron transporter family protein
VKLGIPDTGPEFGSSPIEAASSRGTGGRLEEKHKHIRGRGLVSSSALGLSDGLVTNLAFLTGFSGANTGIDLVRFAGLAAMLAGAVSMLFGGILSARAEHDLFEADSKREAYEIEHEPQEERDELLHLYMEKGLTDQEARIVVNRISSDKRKFLEDMLTNELHVHSSNLENPVKIGAVIGLSFLLGAFVPLAPYYLFAPKESAATLSIVISLFFLYAAGAWKGSLAGRSTLRAGLETLSIGALATLILYLIGQVFAVA